MLMADDFLAAWDASGFRPCSCAHLAACSGKPGLLSEEAAARPPTPRHHDSAAGPRPTTTIVLADRFAAQVARHIEAGETP